MSSAQYTIGHDLTPEDFDILHRFLRTSYWSKGIPRDVMERSIQGSLPFVVRDAAGKLVGFARVTSDRATFRYIGDLFILPEHRGQGLSKRLMRAILGHPELQGFRRWMLATDDAHGLYKQFGFTPLHNPDVLMERRSPDAYRSA